MTKSSTSMRLSDPARQKLAVLAELYGNQTTALEIAIDRLYEQDGAKRLREAAEHHIAKSKTLEPYRETILYDWPNEGEHLFWVVTAPEAEVLDWAQTVSV